MRLALRSLVVGHPLRRLLRAALRSVGTPDNPGGEISGGGEGTRVTGCGRDGGGGGSFVDPCNYVGIG